MGTVKTFLLFGLVLALVNAEPNPEPAKTQLRSTYFDKAADSSLSAVVLPVDGETDDEPEFHQSDDTVVAKLDDNTPSKADESTGRLFLKKFMMFKNLFNNQQPVIPIIITGAGATSPTSTLTSTGTVPTATGTIATSPATAGTGAGTGAAAGAIGRIKSHDEDESDVQGVDVQALQAALGAAAQEYVVTDQEIRGTSDSKATKQGSSISLKRKGAKRGQVIQVRIPPRYRNYFKNGQKVMLNVGNRQGNRVTSKRRVVKKRGNKNRRRGNAKNKRNRFVPFV